MTWFLQDLPDQVAPLAMRPASSFGERVGAAFTTEQIETNSWNRGGVIADSLERELSERLPASPIEASNARPTNVRQPLARRRARLLERARIAKEADPEAFADVPTTQEEWDAKVLELRKAEYAEAKAVLDAAPSDAFGAEFVGRTGASIVDPVTLATLPIGGSAGAGVSVLRTVAGEAAANMFATSLTLPGRQRVADELGTPEPDVLTELAFAGVLGGALGGGVAAISRGVSRRAGYDVERGAATAEARQEGESGVAQERAVTAAAEALRQGAPLPAAARPYDEDATLNAIIGVESGGVADARNPNSSAQGLGQFISSTWMDMIRRHRPDLLDGRSANEVLNLRDDPRISREMTRLYMRENREKLREAGLPSGPGEVYLSHFLGPAGAADALRGPLNASIRSIMSPDAIAANTGISFNGKRFSQFTLGDLRGWARHKMRSAYDPNAQADMPSFEGYTTTRGYTGTGQVRVGDDLTLDVAYEVVDASLLQKASGRFQPRDRSSINSDAWIADTAVRLDPAQLMPSPTADRGTPIIGPDNMIESGNGRFSAIQRAYDRHPDRADAYRQQIEAAGFAIPEGVDRPVLVARRRTELDDDAREAMTIEAQDSGVARMRPKEIAQTSARAMTADRLSRFRPDVKLTDPENASFVQSALSGLPRSERNAFFDDDGALNAEGRRRLRQAFFARAWSDDALVSRYAESEDAGELRALMDALEQAAPAWATLRAEIEAGVIRPEFDITDHVVDAMRLIEGARKEAAKGGTVGDALIALLAQDDMFAGTINPLVQALLGKFWRGDKAAPAKDVAQFLTRYADEARQAGRTGDMLGATPAEVLKRLDGKAFGDLPEVIPPARSENPAPADIPSISEQAFAQGADSPEAVAADEQAAADLLAAADGPFGPIFQGLTDQPEAAIEALMAAGRGEVPDAMIHPELGPIAFVFGQGGKKGFGLEHIREKHGEAVLRDLPNAIRAGIVIREPNGRVYIDRQGDPLRRTVLKLEWMDQPKTWVLTSHNRFLPGSAEGGSARQGRTTDVPPAGDPTAVPGSTGQVESSPSDLADQEPSLAELVASSRTEFGDLTFTDENGIEIRAADLLADIEDDVAVEDIISTCSISGGASWRA